MEQQTTSPIKKNREEELSMHGLQRRKFLSYLGLSASIVTIGAACTKDITKEGIASATDASNSTAACVDLGSGDYGILNYAYALEQLEAAFYIQVIANFYTGGTERELHLLNDIRKHEIAHREFFKIALGAKAIPALKVDFSSIDFSSRDSVLGTAKAFEDLGVSAYNGAGQLIAHGKYLGLAGKIVSVEARHAAYIRDLITPNTFVGSDVIDMNGLEISRSPQEVLAIASTYIVTEICADNLPTN